jgi:hypothetical protein
VTFQSRGKTHLVIEGLDEREERGKIWMWTGRGLGFTLPRRIKMTRVWVGGRLFLEMSKKEHSRSDTSVVEAVKRQRKEGNYLRNNLQKYRVTPSEQHEDDDALTTRSVISTISNQGKIETVNQYKLIKLLGQGSFAKVFLAKDSNLG